MRKDNIVIVFKEACNTRRYFINSLRHLANYAKSAESKSRWAGVWNCVENYQEVEVSPAEFKRMRFRALDYMSRTKEKRKELKAVEECFDRYRCNRASLKVFGSMGD